MKAEMKKPMVITLLGLIIFFGLVVALKVFILKTEKKISTQFQNPIVTVSAEKAENAVWNPNLSVVGSTDTVEGVNVTTELPGMITEIDFVSGANVKKGDVLVRLDIAPDIAKLHSLQAQAVLDKITYDRDLKQYSFGAVSKEQVDTDEANMKSTAANVAQQEAIIQKKIIRAPFSGKLGISVVNLGQYLNSGNEVVPLQQLDPIYVNFYLPQQEIPDAYVGQTVQVTTNRLPGKVFTGKITSINPVVETDVRNVEVQATLSNPQEILLPGMFTDVKMNVGTPKTFITLPALAVTYNPYGAIVYILKQTNQMHDGKPLWTAEQQFVDTGDTRGDQIAILKGITVGDLIVTSGQLKLKNGSTVMIDNSIQPPNNPAPVVGNR